MQVYLNDEYALDDDYKEMIEPTKYYLGGRANSSANGELFYTSERSETVNNADRSKNWTGNIALMYPSDYVFTYALGVDDTCYNTPVSCSNSIPSNGWLYRSEYHQWTLAPCSSNASSVFYVHFGGGVGNLSAYSSNGYSPVVYLKPNVRIKSGDGSIDNPYEFEL